MPTRARISLLAVLLAATEVGLIGLSTAACAGHALGPVYVDSIPANSRLTGTILSKAPGWQVSRGSDIALGDGEATYPPHGALRGFVGFALTSIPGGARLVSAKLALQQCFTLGAPYSTLGDVIVDHVAYGTIFDTLEYGAAALVSDIGTLSSDTTPSLKVMSVLGSVIDDLNSSRSLAEFRVRMSGGETVNDGHDNIVVLYGGEFSTQCGQPLFAPRLIVNYVL